jgi:hypothetical protein
MTEGSNKLKEGLCLWMLLVDDDDRLRVLWTGLLRDYVVLKIFKASQLQVRGMFERILCMVAAIK